MTLFCSSSAYAAVTAAPTCADADEVHCAQTNDNGSLTAVKGTPGKWVEMYWIGGPSVTTCASLLGYGMSIYPSDIQAAIRAGVIKGLSPVSPVNVTWLFLQCNDQSCLSYKSLGLDMFQLSVTNAGQYTAQPRSYQITPIDPNYGQSCNVTSNSVNFLTLNSGKKQ